MIKLNPRRSASIAGGLSATLIVSSVIVGCGGTSGTASTTAQPTIVTAPLATATTTAAAITTTTTTTSQPTVASTIQSTAASTTSTKVTQPVGSLPPVPDEQQSIVYDHPTLGAVTISIAYPTTTDYTLFSPTVQARVNATGDTVFEWGVQDQYEAFRFAGGEFNPDISNPVDGRGHVFFEWNPGRFPGVSYLMPTETGFDSNGTLTDSFYDGHYYATLIDEDGDGKYEIEQAFQRCVPDCASGGGYTHVWTWDGSAYTGSDLDPNNYEDGGPPDAPDQLEPAKQLFTDYLLAAGAREYQRAWSMLDSYYQDEYGGFDKFVAFWDRIDSVGTESMDASLGEGSVLIDTIIWFELTDGTRQRESVSVTIYYGDDGQSIGDYYVNEVLD